MNLRNFTLSILYNAIKILPASARTYTYWKIRSREFGRMSVLNLSHSSDEYEAVTTAQKNEIFPVLKKYLRKSDTICLDFGCGPGRFTADLAVLMNGTCIGVDPISELIHLAPKNDRVSYKVMHKGRIPLDQESVDVIWCCLVLGGIPESLLSTTVHEMLRVLRGGGLMILIENTSAKHSGDYWMFRSAEFYRTLFPDVDLQPVHSYTDCGETISVIIGRKKT
ncbi:MAG: class I SAM-dependent methyltransferase [Bacteroidota bacterium]